MKEGKERPAWFKGVVSGGKSEGVPDTKREPVISPQDVPSMEPMDDLAKESDLVRLYMGLSGKPPANFAASVRSERVQEAAKVLPAWTVDALHTYLSSGEVWQRPSFTKAVFDEVHARMLRGKMGPRE